jgi:hypothetical protein
MDMSTLDLLQKQQREMTALRGQLVRIPTTVEWDGVAIERGCTHKRRRFALGGVYCGTDYFSANGQEVFYTMTGTPRNDT